MGWKTSFGDADEIEMEAESMTTPERDALIAKGRHPGQLTAASGKTPMPPGKLLTPRNVIIAVAVLGGAYYLYKRRG